MRHADSGGIMHSCHNKHPHLRKEQLENALPPRHAEFQKMLIDLGEYLSYRGYSEYKDASLILQGPRTEDNM